MLRIGRRLPLATAPCAAWRAVTFAALRAARVLILVMEGQYPGAAPAKHGSLPRPVGAGGRVGLRCG